MPQHYIDGYVLPVAEDKVDAYKKIATKAGKIWIEHGALEYRECVGDDFGMQGVLPFPRLAKTKPGETVIFAYVVYKSRADRDRVNAKVMADPRIAGMDTTAVPFDSKRMAFGGFKTIVHAVKKEAK